MEGDAPGGENAVRPANLGFQNLKKWRLSSFCLYSKIKVIVYWIEWILEWPYDRSKAISYREIVYLCSYVHILCLLTMFTRGHFSSDTTTGGIVFSLRRSIFIRITKLIKRWKWEGRRDKRVYSFKFKICYISEKKEKQSISQKYMHLKNEKYRNLLKKKGTILQYNYKHMKHLEGGFFCGLF